MKKLFMFLIFLLSIVSVSAIDLDNISFTNEEFFNGAVTATKVIELSNGKLAVGYISSNTIYLKICDIDGTNCGSEIIIKSAASINDFDIIQDITNNRILFTYGTNSQSQTYYTQLDGSSLTFLTNYNVGISSYISTVQINSSDFAIAFQDISDSNRGKLIICELDSSSCGSENTFYALKVEYIKMIKTTTDKLEIAYEANDGNLYLNGRNLDGSAYHGSRVIASGAKSYIDMIEGSDNKLKIIYRDNSNSLFGTFRSCDLVGLNCGSEIVYTSNNAPFNSLIEGNSILFIAGRDDGTPGNGVLNNFNLNGGDISNRSIFDPIFLGATTSIIFTSTEQLLIAYVDNTNSKGMFAISEPFVTAPTMTSNIQPYYNTSDISITLTNDGIVNATETLEMFYSLDGASNVSLGNTTNITFSLLSLNDSLHNIIFSLVSTQGNSTLSESFTIDTTLPDIAFAGMVDEYNQINRIVNLLSQVTDSNPDTCEYKLDSDLYVPCSTNINLNENSAVLDIDSSHILYVRAIDLAGNENINTFSFDVIPYRMILTFINTLSEEEIDQITFNDIDFANIINTGSNTTLTLYHDPGTYSYQASKTSYVNSSGTYTISEAINTQTIDLGPIFMITLKDEKTLGLFNLSNTDLVTLKITCDDESVIQTIIISNVHDVDITCKYKNFVYTIESTDEYFRSLNLDRNELNHDVYLINPLDIFLLKTFVVYDYLGDFENPALTLFRNIGNDLVQITGDFVDVENKLTTYLLNNQQYVIKLTSDNQIERNLGTFDAVLPSGTTSFIQLLDIDKINLESTETVNDIFVRAFKTGTIENQNLYVQYNDSTLSTTFVDLTIYSKNKYGPILYQSDSTSNNVLFSINNISQYNASSFYIAVDYTTKYGTLEYTTVVRFDDSIDLGIEFEYLDLNWVVLIVLSFFALILTVSTADVGSIILLTLGGLASMFGWFVIGESLLGLAIVVGIIAFFRGEQK